MANKKQTKCIIYYVLWLLLYYNKNWKGYQTTIIISTNKWKKFKSLINSFIREIH